MQVALPLGTALESDVQRPSKATCIENCRVSHRAMQVALGFASRFYTSLSTMFYQKRLARFSQKTATFWLLQVALPLFYQIREYHMRTRTYTHEANNSVESGKATCMLPGKSS